VQSLALPLKVNDTNEVNRLRGGISGSRLTDRCCTGGQARKPRWVGDGTVQKR